MLNSLDGAGSYVAGIATATLAGNFHTLSLNTSAPGVASGTVTVSSISQAAQDATFSQAVSTTVMAHARPSFTPETQTIDRASTSASGRAGRHVAALVEPGAIHQLVAGRRHRLCRDARHVRAQ